MIFGKMGASDLLALFRRRRLEVSSLIARGGAVFFQIRPQEKVHVKNNGNYEVISNYSWLPTKTYLEDAVVGEGERISLSDSHHFAAPYFRSLQEHLSYYAYYQSEYGKRPFLLNPAGGIVGASAVTEAGAIVGVPGFITSPPSGQLLAALLESTRDLFEYPLISPAPPWAGQYDVPGEHALEEAIQEIDQEASALEVKREFLVGQKRSLELLRSLLYEQGRALEEAVIYALRILGFQAERHQEEDFEHDVHFESSEGRGIAEIEGRDGSPIKIKKLDQLTRVVDEEFVRTNAYPRGVLLGNAFRLTNPSERGDTFTEKVKIAAKRKNFGLLPTSELFEAAMRVLIAPEDEELKRGFRAALLEDRGGEIKLIDDGSSQ